jgi:NADH:ubiquinone oxidoreductase subunit K
LNYFNFFTLLFWLSTSTFLFNSKNLITVILYSEIMWVVLYSYTAVTGTINDDLILSSTTFFLLALAGLEFCIGFIITIFFKNFKKSFDLDMGQDHLDNKLKKKLTTNRYVWAYTIRY